MRFPALRVTRPLQRRPAWHPELFVVKLDVSDEAEAREVAKQAVAKFGRIGLLVNNAG